MFVLFAIANLMSFTFTGQTFDRMSVALATCKGDFGEMYVFEYARTANIPLDTAYIRCTNIVLEEDKININDPR